MEYNTNALERTGAATLHIRSRMTVLVKDLDPTRSQKMKDRFPLERNNALTTQGTTPSLLHSISFLSSAYLFEDFSLQVRGNYIGTTYNTKLLNWVDALLVASG